MVAFAAAALILTQANSRIDPRIAQDRTDAMTSHFVPVRGKDKALRRLQTWKPF